MDVRPDVAAFDVPVRAFVSRLLARWPAWWAHLEPIPDAAPGGGGVLLEVPSPAEPSLVLWAEVRPGEATVGLGERAAEQLFVWSEPDHEPAYGEIVAFIERVVAGEIVLAWRRERFLWSTAEQGRFRTRAEASADRRVTRVQSWPGFPAGDAGSAAMPA